MSDWCLAHPWMTFFIVMGLVSSISVRIRWTRPKEDK